jgi:hypothetical protein
MSSRGTTPTQSLAATNAEPRQPTQTVPPPRSEVSGEGREMVGSLSVSSSSGGSPLPSTPRHASSVAAVVSSASPSMSLTSPSKQTLDLSHSLLRVPNTTHLNTLRSLGIRGSTCISITMNRQLYGVFAFNAVTHPKVCTHSISREEMMVMDRMCTRPEFPGRRSMSHVPFPILLHRCVCCSFASEVELGGGSTITRRRRISISSSG